MKQLRSVDIVDIDEFGDYALASGLSVLRAATLIFFSLVSASTLGVLFTF